jgi:hypothetical protein
MTDEDDPGLTPYQALGYHGPKDRDRMSSRDHAQTTGDGREDAPPISLNHSEIEIQKIEENNITFTCGDGRDAVTIKHNGDLVVHIAQDEAARVFWNCVAMLRGQTPPFPELLATDKSRDEQ